MKRNLQAALVTSLFITLTACGEKTENVESKPAKKIEQPSSSVSQATEAEVTSTKLIAKPKVEKNMIEVTGTILFKGMEGGFYALDADNGKKYTPQGLEKAHLAHGLKVRVTGSILNVPSIQQYGQILKISSVEVLGKSDIDSNEM